MPTVNSRCPKPYVQLMTSCLDGNPELRPDFLGEQGNIVTELEHLIHEEYQKWLPATRDHLILERRGQLRYFRADWEGQLSTEMESERRADGVCTIC